MEGFKQGELVQGHKLKVLARPDLRAGGGGRSKQVLGTEAWRTGPLPRASAKSLLKKKKKKLTGPERDAICLRVCSNPGLTRVSFLPGLLSLPLAASSYTTPSPTSSPQEGADSSPGDPRREEQVGDLGRGS